MAHIEKFKQGGINGLFLHNGREAGDGHAHSNEEIDSSRTHLNYDLCKTEGTLSERFRKRLGQVHCMKRDDVNVLDSLVVHLPEDIRAGDERKFFEACYAFACADFKEKNIIGGNVHRDEKREHIHISFIPVIEGKRRNGEACEKVCHDKLITREYYKKLHERLSDFVAEQLGYEVSILNGATAGGNKTVQELKAKTLEEENAKAEQELHQKQEQALAYDLSSPKKLTESKGAYEERVKTHQQAVAVQQREQELDKEVEGKAVELAKRLTVKRLESERDKARAGEWKAVQAHREALARVQELERQNADLAKQRQNVIKQNDVLLEMVEDMHEELTGECIEGEELLKRKLKSQKPKSKQIGR